MKNLLMSLGTLTAIAAPLTAVIACSGTTSTNDDEGFKNAATIQNFDIKSERQTIETTYSIKFNGKTYADCQLFLNDWCAKVNKFIPTADDFKKNSMGDLTIAATFKEGDVYFQLSQGGVPKTGNGYEITDSLQNFDATVNRLLGLPSFNGAAPTSPKTYFMKENPVDINVKRSVAPPKDSIDSIIYSQAQTLKNTIKTDKDKAYIGNYGGHILDGHTKDINLTPYKPGNSGFYDLTTEYRPGDSIIFAFDKESDLASFTQRVRYDNTSDFDNNMPIEKVGLKTIKYQPIGIENGQLMAQQVKDYSMGDDVSIFKLNVIARNAVELVFNDMFTPSNYHIDAQLLYLSAFTDENKDGKIDKNDVNMVGPFAVDKGRVYSSYNNKQYIHKETTIAGYDEVKATYDTL